MNKVAVVYSSYYTDVIQGLLEGIKNTDHYENISNSVANGLLNLTINKNLYIANCILNVHNLEQANIRATQELNKGSEAANAINLLFT